MRQHFVVDLEVLLRIQAERGLQGCDLVLAKGRAVDLAGVLLVRRGPADDGAQGDDRGAGGLCLRGLERTVQLGDVLDVLARLRPVDPLRVPAVGGIPPEHVFGEGDVGVVFDGDVVLVVDHYEVPQLLVPGERGRLGSDAFLKVAVRSNHPDGVVERALTLGRLGIQQSAHATLGVGEPDGGRQALPEGAGGDFHAGGVAVLRMPGCL